MENGVDLNQPKNVGGEELTYGTLIQYVHHLFLSHRLVYTTPLYIASQNGHSDIVNTLKNGANINQPHNVGRGLTYGTLCLSLIHDHPTQDGATPLFIASQNGHSDIVNTLIRNGADINQPLNVGRGLIYDTLIMHLFLHTDWCNSSVYS